MNKNNLDLYVCNTYDDYINLRDNFEQDKAMEDADKSARFYFHFSDKIDNAKLFLLVDKQQNKLLNYAFIESDHESNSNIVKKDCLYIDFIQTPLAKNMAKGYASRMLDYISDYARREGYRKIHLMALGSNPRYLYYKKGFVNVSHPNKMSVMMYKYLDENDWACSVLINEALNNSNQYISPSQAMKNIIKLKQYDNMFEYGVIKENEYGDKKTNPVEVFVKWDKFANRLYKTNSTIKAFCKVFDKPIVKKSDYKEKMALFETFFPERTKEKAHLNNVLEGVNLLKTSKKFDDEIKRMQKQNRLQKQRQLQRQKCINNQTRLTQQINLNPTNNIKQEKVYEKSQF